MINILRILNNFYNMSFTDITKIRDGGSVSYAVYSDSCRYFLRVIKPAFIETAISGVNIQVFLQNREFSVPLVVLTKDNLPYARTESGLFILYEFIEGSDSDTDQDIEDIGMLISRLHNTMRDYTGELKNCDRQFYIGRYIDILIKKQYPKTDEFIKYGNTIWEKVKDLPRGYCHGDMYSGNIYKTPDKKLYILDFDTSCNGFPMYDLALICNKTHYFNFDESGYFRSKELLARLLPGYSKVITLSKKEIDAFYDLIALYHFALQATIIENNGLDCVNNGFLDKQLDWLLKWKEQCESVIVTNL